MEDNKVDKKEYTMTEEQREFLEDLHLEQLEQMQSTDYWTQDMRFLY